MCGIHLRFKMSWNHLIKPSKATNTAPLPSQQLVAWAESVKAQIGSFYKENGFSRHLLYIFVKHHLHVCLSEMSDGLTADICTSTWLELEQQNTETQTRHNTEHPGSSSGHLGSDKWWTGHVGSIKLAGYWWCFLCWSLSRYFELYTLHTPNC